MAGTGFGTAVGIAPRQVPLAIGRGHIGAGTGGTGGGVGNASGGINDTPRAGTGGIRDTTSWGLSTGGITGTGRGLSAATGGINDGGTFGRILAGSLAAQLGQEPAERATSIASVPERGHQRGKRTKIPSSAIGVMVAMSQSALGFCHEFDEADFLNRQNGSYLFPRMTFQWKCPFAVNAHLLKINDLHFQELACIFFSALTVTLRKAPQSRKFF